MSVYKVTEATTLSGAGVQFETNMVVQHDEQFQHAFDRVHAERHGQHKAASRYLWVYVLMNAFPLRVDGHLTPHQLPPGGHFIIVPVD